MEERNHILIVEESFDISLITSKIFEYQNWKVTKASTGEEALSFLKSNDADVILMDISLPGMSGLECCNKIRKLTDKVKSITPIIAVTANANNFSLSQYKERGFTDFFQKPVNFDKLIGKIKSILHKN
jgi:DNA-binding response OmpR family regulator